ncbi:hypothetical protein D3C72_2147470 [compost metagenome]
MRELRGRDKLESSGRTAAHELDVLLVLNGRRELDLRRGIVDDGDCTAVNLDLEPVVLDEVNFMGIVVVVEQNHGLTGIGIPSKIGCGR